MKVINLFAGPGAGKSTTAAGVFHEMKRLGYNIELVTEYAKDLTWEGRSDILDSDQIYIFAKQNRRINRLLGKVDWVITDSPLLLSAVYRSDHTPKSLDNLVMDCWNQYENINYFLNRETRFYNPIGRSQTKEQALEVDSMVETMLVHFKIDYKVISSVNDPTIHILGDVLGVKKDG